MIDSLLTSLISISNNYCRHAVMQWPQLLLSHDSMQLVQTSQLADLCSVSLEAAVPGEYLPRHPVVSSHPGHPISVSYCLLVYYPDCHQIIALLLWQNMYFWIMSECTDFQSKSPWQTLAQGLSQKFLFFWSLVFLHNLAITWVTCHAQIIVFPGP